MARVYTGGTFDLFHSGHVNFLRQCWELAQLVGTLERFKENSSFYPYVDNRKVIVSLNSDEFIKAFKGKAPVYTYEERRAILLGTKYVSEVIENIGNEDSKPAIELVKPTHIAIGSDWACKDYYKQMNFTQDWLDLKDIQLVYFPYTEGASTTELKKRILGA